jgi:hypothetical protein
LHEAAGTAPVPIDDLGDATTSGSGDGTTIDTTGGGGEGGGGRGGGHLRIGWSTRFANLQAPVGYDEHSYAIRDVSGSRVHKSRREDRWGGIGFGIGDVVGVLICLVDGGGGRAGTATAPENDATTTTTTSTTHPSDGIDDNRDHETGDVDEVTSSIAIARNHIRFFKNGKSMGSDGIAFDDVAPGTYYPAISCYGDGRAYMNFGPYFVYPPGAGLPADMDLRPVSELCRPPPLPEEAVEGVTSSGSKEGKNAFFSKRTDDGILFAFKELVRVEAMARHRAYVTHMGLHTLDISTIRKERSLPTLDIQENSSLSS